MAVAILDTSVLIAAARAAETRHLDAARTLVEHSEGGLALPATVLTETLGLIRARWGADMQRTYWQRLSTMGFEIVPVGADLVENARRIDETYADAEFGFVDSTILACCEELRIARVLSLDRRLACFRPTFAPALEVLP